MNDYSVILFPSGTQSIWTSRLLKKAGIERKLVPIPRALSSDCGYCVRIRTVDIQSAKDVLIKAGIEFTRIEEWGQYSISNVPRFMQ
jgi:hypothetical protein